MRRYIIISLLLLIFVNLHAQHRCARPAWDLKSSSSDSLDVLHYAIDLDIIYLSKQQIKGNAALTIVPLFANLTSISLDLQNLVVDSVQIDGVNNPQWTYNDTLLRISLAAPLTLSDTVLCKVYYHGNPQRDPSNWGGFYFSSDSTFAYNMGVGMQDDPHNYGRIWYPCVDNFTDRATYDFSIEVKNANTAICNGTLTAVQNHNQTKTYQWSLQHDIPTYLASVAVGAYSLIADTFHSMSGSDIPIAIYVPANQVANAQASFANLQAILEAYEYYYGPYRWERIGYVGVPFSSGAMEHATSIHIGTAYLNGTTDYETLIAHELSHHWFGDLVTCHSAPDMWLNEGWAVFSESMYQERVYGRKAYVDNIRTELFDVLKNTHNSDNGYWAVSGVPHELTYGSTVYDKGGTVAHSLRGYIGDDLFFPAIRAYMSQKAFSDQTSYQFRDFMSQHTGIDLTEFFESWVFDSGFSQFAIDSFTVTNPHPFEYLVNVSVRQALSHKPFYANDNRMPITFMDDNFRRIDTVLQFSGQYGSQYFQLDFEPTAVFVDVNETMADATTEYNQVHTQTGITNYEMSYFNLEVAQLTDSVFFQIKHNWVAPDTLGTSYPGLHLSNKRYWTVNFNQQSTSQLKGQFRYSRTVDMDMDIITSSQDSLVLLYRKHGGIAWQRVSFTRPGSWIAGYIYVDDLLPGEYVLASYDAQHLGIPDAPGDSRKVKLSVSPNPSNDYFVFEANCNYPTELVIYDTTGKQVAKLKMQQSSSNSSLKWNPRALASGTYFGVLLTEDSVLLDQTKIIIKK